MINFRNVSKSFGAQQILRNASFLISSGERIGIVGPNGSGKSTVFSLLTGGLSVDEGEISVPRKCRIGYLHQQANASASTDSVLEYAESGMPELADLQRKMDKLEKVFSDTSLDQGEKDRMLKEFGELQTKFEDMDGYSLRNRAESALSGLGFSVDDFGKPVKEFSGGWQMRADLVRVLIADPEILLLDEPSNYLDIPAIEWLQRFLRDFSGTMVLISHDRHLLNSLTSITLEIANAQATRYAGNYDYYIKERINRYEQMLAAHKNQERKKEQTQRFIDRFRSKNTKSAAVQSRIKMLEKMEEIEIPRQLVSKGNIRLPDPIRCGQEVISLNDVGVTYDQERWVLRGVNLRIERGDKIALIGLNGLGKTTLLRMLSGQLAPSEGKRIVGHKVTEGYQSQEFAELMNESVSVYDTVRSVGASASDQQVRALLGGFGFSGSDVEKKVQVLSGGEKVRLAFARMLIDPPNFLLLDEPTTHLDITAREALEGALSKFKGTLCIVSHDIEFVRHIADTVIAMTPPGIKRYHGGYDYYHEKAAEQSIEAVKTVRPQPSARKVDRRDRAKVVQKYSKVRRELQKQISKIEKSIEKYEEERERVLAELSKEGADYKELNKELATVQQKLGDYNFRWETFAIELDDLEQEYAAKRKDSN